MANIEYRALLQCAYRLTDLLQHDLSVSAKLLEKGLIPKDAHDYVLTAQGVSSQHKASRLVSCLTDRVKDAAKVFHDFVDLLKENPFFSDIVEKINTEYKTLQENEKPRDHGKVEKVNIVETVSVLEKQFSNMQRRLQTEMRSNSEVSAEMLVDSLTLLPISLRAEYQKFVFDNLKTLEKAESIREIFHHLNLHFTFIDYRLLEFLINEYGSRRLKKDMSTYTRRVQAFMDETTVQQLMDHWPGRPDIPPHFEKLRAVIDRDPKTYTLRQLDDLRKRLCSETRLSETILILIGVGRKNSFLVCWVVPSVFVPQLKSAIIRLSMRRFFRRECIFSVTVGTHRLYSIAAAYEERLLLLCRERRGDIRDFRDILSHPGLDVNIYDKVGITPLLWLSHHGRTELVQLLLQHGAVVDLPADDEYGDTALMAACSEGHVMVAAVLIEKGALVNYKNKKGSHPLHTASFNNRLECVELLLNNDAQINLPTDDDFGPTALILACQEGNSSVARLLVERGAAIDYQDKQGMSPLYMASQEGHDEVVQLLLDRGASVDLPAKTTGRSAIFFAVEKGNLEIIKLLIKSGAKLDIKDNDGLTAFEVAKAHEQRDVCDLLEKYRSKGMMQGIMQGDIKRAVDEEGRSQRTSPQSPAPPKESSTSLPEELDFVERPSEDFFCPVTFELLDDPHLTACCGNHLSPRAVTRLKSEGKPCPICKEPDLVTVLDKFHRRRVRAVRVRCPHTSSGCEWVGEEGELSQHIQSCLKRHMEAPAS